MQVLSEYGLIAIAAVAMIWAPGCRCEGDAPPMSEATSGAPQVLEADGLHPRGEARKDALGDPLPGDALQRLGTVRWRHPGGATAALPTPDGRAVFTAGRDGRVRLWSREDGRPLMTFESHDGQWIQGGDLSADGRLAVTGGLDRAVRRWDLGVGAELPVMDGHEGFVDAVAVDAAGARVASASRLGDVILWDAAAGQRLQDHGVPEAATAVALSPDGARLAAGSRRGHVTVWSTEGGVQLWTTEPVGGRVEDLRFSPDGARLAVSTATGGVWVASAADGRRLTTFEGRRLRVGPLAFSPDGARIAAGEGSRLTLWDAATGARVSTLGEATGDHLSLRFTADGAAVVSASADGVVRIFAADGSGPQPGPPGHGGAVTAMARQRDGSWIATGAEDGRLRVWDPDSGALIKDLEAHRRPMVAALISPDGRRLLTVDSGGDALAWDPATWAEPAHLKLPADGIKQVAQSPDGATLAVASGDKEIKLLDAVTLGELRTLVGGGGRIISVAFSPDGGLVAAGSRSGDVYRWEVGGGEPLSLKASGTVDAVAALAGGHVLAGAGDGSLLLFAPDEQLAPLRLGGEPGGIVSLAVSADGAWAVTGDRAGRVVRWDLTDRQVMQRLEGHGAEVGVVVMGDDPQGRRFVTGSADGTALRWKVVR